MKCFGYGGEKCSEPGTIADPETPAIFINPEDPNGPKVQPVHCRAHDAVMMRNRGENEASWRRLSRLGVDTYPA